MLANISRKQFDSTNLGEVIEGHRVICQDEMYVAMTWATRELVVLGASKNVSTPSFGQHLNFGEHKWPLEILIGA